jgi:DHA1 family bicyclomycin/chloramphenicol resistance-like MFS transporter
VLGGALHEWFGWRSVFVFLACFATGIAAWSALSLPETHPLEHRHPLHAGRLARSYAATLTHRGFVASALAAAFGFTALFLYVATAPALLLRHLHVRETQFFWLFGPVTFGMMLGGYLSGRVAGRLDAARTLAWGFGAMTVSTIGNVAFHSLHSAALPWTVMPLFFYAAGIAMSLPTLTLMGLDFFPKHRGLAASCQAFLLTAANALTTGLLAPVASESPLRLALASAGLLALGLGCLPFLRMGVNTRHAVEPPPFPEVAEV